MKKKPYPENNDGIGIGDVSKICGISGHTIRYWEREFGDELSPGRTPGKQRRYRDEDIERLLRIKKLLWEDNYSIKGAKRVMRDSFAIHDISTAKQHIPNAGTHELALQIARLINEQLLQVNTAA